MTLATLLLAILSLMATLALGAVVVLLRQRSMRLERLVSQHLVEIDVLREQSQQWQRNTLALIDALGSRIDALDSRQEETIRDLGSLTEQFQRVEMHAGLCVPPKPLPSGFNINKRVEVVRMFHEGFSEEAISEELAVPMGEVRLLIHLERTASATASAASGRNGSPGSHAA